MVNKMVYKERLEAIWGVMIGEIIWNLQETKDRQQVGPLHDSIKVYNFNCKLSSLVGFQLDCPHAYVHIRFLVVNKPVDSCTKNVLLTIVKRKKELNTHNFHASHSLFGIIKNNKDSH